MKEIDDLTLQSATGRVAGYLCGQYVYKGQDRVEFDLDASLTAHGDGSYTLDPVIKVTVQ